MRLELSKVAAGYGCHPVIKDVSLEVEAGEILCLLGPNGSGKTTLLKAILGFLKLQAGEICLDGEDISSWPRARLARVMGYIPQAHHPPFPFKVLDVVLMGRTAHLGPLAAPGPRDVEIARQALAALNISYLEDRVYTEISGGERQLVLIARALAQQPQVLIMDEPTSSLDFGNQVRVLGRIAELASQGLSIIMATHFPNHAFTCAQKVALVNHGTVVAGPPGSMITEASLKSLYQVDTKILSVAAASGSTYRVCVPMLGNTTVARSQKGAFIHDRAQLSIPS